VVNDKGAVIYQKQPKAERHLDARESYLTLFIMTKVASQGTARALAARFPADPGGQDRHHRQPARLLV